MGYPVTYHCPACETIVELERDGYLADKAVTPYPFEGWTYVEPTAPFEDDAADGVRFVCGASDGVVWNPDEGIETTDADGDVVDSADADGDVVDSADDDGGVVDSADDDGSDDTDMGSDRAAGCGESFYLSFVRYEEGREIDPRPETELVEIDPDPRSSGPRGPSGPGGFW
ncbi:hypothetical protein [Halorubrum tibetense]|uniref:DUF7969 domain-containing protein n=1 Tax=Halorubrum tibetense TaxID=175631 RepID=A0ABD5SFV8_9EURY